MKPDSPTASRQSHPPLGAHIVTPRNGFEHHGIVVGHDRVVHYGGLCRTIHAMPIEEVSLAYFEAGQGWRINRSSGQRFSVEQIIRRARSRVGENHYHLIHNNCEHFCTWCTNGKAISQQVRRYKRLVESVFCAFGLASVLGSMVLVA